MHHTISIQISSCNPSLLTTRWDGTTGPLESAQGLGGLIRLKDLWVSPPLHVSGISTAYTRIDAMVPTLRKLNKWNRPRNTMCKSSIWKELWCCLQLQQMGNESICGSDAGIAGPGFDVLKLFHLYKPNYSWVSETNADNKMEIEILPYQVTLGDTGQFTFYEGDYYWYRPTDIDGGTSAVKPYNRTAFFVDVGNYGDSGRMKGEHPREAFLCCCRKRKQ